MSAFPNTLGLAPHGAGGLAAPTQWLQRSFGRLAGATESAGAGANPGRWADTASFSAASRRLAASLASLDRGSRLDSQDGMLQDAGRILARIGELKALDSDPASSEADRAGFNEEFVQLQAELSALGEWEIDGQPFFSTEDVLVTETEATETGAAVDTETALAGGATPEMFTDDFSTLDNWFSSHGTAAVNENALLPNAGGWFGSVQSRQEFSGPLEIKFDLYLPGAVDSLDVTLGGTTLSNLTDTVNISKWGWHSVRIAYDGAGSAATYVDGSDTAADTQGEVGAATGTLTLANLGLGSAMLRNFSLAGTTGPATGGIAAADEEAPAADAGAADDGGDTSNLSAVAVAGDLETLEFQTVSDALEEIAELQSGEEEPIAELTADDSAESAASLDAEDGAVAGYDEAEELAASARQAMLLEASTAILAQANLSEQTALYFLE